MIHVAFEVARKRLESLKKQKRQIESPRTVAPSPCTVAPSPTCTAEASDAAPATARDSVKKPRKATTPSLLEESPLEDCMQHRS